MKQELLDRSHGKGLQASFLILLAGIAITTFPLLAGADTGAAESAWTAMVRNNPDLVNDRSISFLDRRILQVLTPQQAMKFEEGAEPASITLPNGETLADFMDRVRRSADSGLVFKPLAPCRILDTRSTGGKLVAEESRVFQVRDPDPYFSPQDSTVSGCGVPGLHGDILKSNTARAVLLNVEVLEAEDQGELRMWPANDHPIPEVGLVRYGAETAATGLSNAVIVPLCDEESLHPCAAGDLKIQAEGASTHVAITVLGYYEPERDGGADSLAADPDDDSEPPADDTRQQEGEQNTAVVDLAELLLAEGDGESLLHGCVNTASGEIKVVPAPTACKKHEIAVSLPKYTGGSLEVPAGDLVVAQGSVVVPSGDVSINAGDLNVTGEVHATDRLVVGGAGALSSLVKTPLDSVEITGAPAAIVSTSVFSPFYLLAASGKIAIDSDVTIDGELSCSPPCVGTTDLWDDSVTDSKLTSRFWHRDGTSGTNPVTDFLGTTDIQPLIVKTSGEERLRISADGKVGIGTDTPDAALDVDGEIKGFGVVPIGTIVAWHKNLYGVPALPYGWVECNGQILNDPESPLDRQLIPDLNREERFLRGGSMSGTLQSDMVESHGHSFSATTKANEGAHYHTIEGGFVTNQGDYDRDYQNNGYGAARQTNTDGAHTHTVSGTTGDYGGVETRPINMSVIWIMRIK